MSTNVIFRCFNPFTGKRSVKSGIKIAKLLCVGRTDAYLHTVSKIIMKS